MRIILLGFIAGVLHAQPLSYGFKLGAPISRPDTSGGLFSSSSQGRWAGGPTIELHLPRRFSVEFAALYRSDSTNSSFPLRLGPEQSPYLSLHDEKTKTWDFPTLLKYRFFDGPVRPFLGAGVSWSHRRNEGFASYQCLGPQGSCRPPEYPTELLGGAFRSTYSRFGPAASAGVEIKTRHVTISPEFRWLRRSGHTLNHTSVMVGFTFGR